MHTFQKRSIQELPNLEGNSLSLMFHKLLVMLLSPSRSAFHSQINSCLSLFKFQNLSRATQKPHEGPNPICRPTTYLTCTHRPGPCENKSVSTYKTSLTKEVLVVLSPSHFFMGNHRGLRIEIFPQSRRGSTPSTWQKQVQASFSLMLPFSSAGECHCAERAKCTASEIDYKRQSMPLLLKISDLPKSRVLCSGMEGINPGRFTSWEVI